MTNTGGPWGQYSGGGGPKRPFGGQPPSSKDPINLDDLINKLKGNFKNPLPTGGYTGNLVALLLMASVALWLLSGFYRVESDQVGIEMLFGKWTNEAEPSPPGLHYYWPYPIGSVERPVVTRENRITIGFRPASSGGSRFASNYVDRSAREDVPDEGMMLTGGGALLANMDTVLRQATGLPVSVAEDPLLCVALGTGHAVENIVRLRGVLSSMY